MKPLTTKIRGWIVICLTLAAAVVMAARLINIQIVDADVYKNMLDSRYTSTQKVKAVRGEIVARNLEPLATNSMGYNIILDKAYLPRDEQNDIILRLTKLFEGMDEQWNDKLPITKTAPYAYISGMENEVERLGDLVVVKNAKVEDCLSRLYEHYKLEEYSAEDARTIAGVRYEMELCGFAMNVPYTFASDVDISTVVKVMERSFELPGVDVSESASRYYENSDVAPHIIGATGPLYQEEYQELKNQGYAMDDTIGKSGIESALESQLRGINGKREIYIGPSGEVINAVESEAPEPGNTIVLTLDMNLQRTGQEALAAQIRKLQYDAPSGEGREADSGAAVMVNVKTGEVLAAVTAPSYDLSTYRQNYAELASDELNPLFNRATMGEYAPGSCFKPTVALAGISGGVIDDHSPVHCGRVYTYYAGASGTGYQPTCLSYHGNISLTTALAYSCNIFFYDTGRRAGIESITQFARQLGLGSDTGIEIATASGQNSTPETKALYSEEPWYPGDVLQSSIGQLYNQFTPLQLANYAATIANRGKRMQMTVVHEIRDYSQETVVQPFQAQQYDTVEAPGEAFTMVINGMVAASRWGSASAEFGAYPVDVASKTGTPQTNDFPNSTFICFAPAEDPEVAVAVVIEKGWHGYTGAPVARALLDEYFGYPRKAIVAKNAPREDIQAAAGLSGSTPEESQSGSEPAADQQPSSGVEEMVN